MNYAGGSLYWPNEPFDVLGKPNKWNMPPSSAHGSVQVTLKPEQEKPHQEDHTSKEQLHVKSPIFSGTAEHITSARSATQLHDLQSTPRLAARLRFRVPGVGPPGPETHQPLDPLRVQLATNCCL